jgi:hypothetical protein
VATLLPLTDLCSLPPPSPAHTQSARIDARLFTPESTLFDEYTNSDAYDNSFAKLSSIFGVNEVNISREEINRLGGLWTSDRCAKEIGDLRKEIEPRVRLANSATGRSDPTFYEQCAGKNPLLWALLYCILRTSTAGTSVFRPLFYRDMGETGYDSLEGYEVEISQPPSVATPSVATAAAGKRSGEPSLEEEDLRTAKEARRAAAAVADKETVAAASAAADLFMKIQLLPESQRAPLMVVYQAMIDKLTAQASEAAPPPPVPVTVAAISPRHPSL